MSELVEYLNRVEVPLFAGAGIIRTQEEIERYIDPSIAVQIPGSYSWGNEWGGNDPNGTRRVTYWDEATQSFYNAIGLKNPGTEAASLYLPDSIKKAQAAGQKVILSLTTVGEQSALEMWPRLAVWAVAMGVDGIEFNGSCPNEKAKSGVLCHDIDSIGEATEAVNQVIDPDVYRILKVSALPYQTIQTYKYAHLLAINGIMAINNCRRLSPARHDDPEQREINVNDGYAGQSGPIIAPLARESLVNWRFHEYSSLSLLEHQPRPPYDVWSIGGLEDGYDGYERVNKLGALAFGSAQGFYRSNNPAATAKQINQEYLEAAEKII